jgi:hypothetical protein
MNINGPGERGLLRFVGSDGMCLCFAQLGNGSCGRNSWGWRRKTRLRTKMQ